MAPSGLAVREMTPDDVMIRIEYFHDSTDQHLEFMGVDRSLLPTPEAWRRSFEMDHRRSIDERKGYGLIWELDDLIVGFSTLDHIKRGEVARMHLHVLDSAQRKSGLGTQFVQLSVAHYIDRFDLKSVICEPRALNAAPNRALQAAGFRFVYSYDTTPGSINVPQTVTRWEYHAAPTG